MVLCLALAVAANKSLDHFVSIIGSFACIPLAFILPAWFHFDLVATKAEGGWSRVLDIAIIVFGVLAMLASLIAAIADWASHPISLPV